MIPLYLRLSGFLSYREPAELDFTGFNLACISGNNGAGKSSLLDAITWALFGQARRKDDDLINSGAKAAEVIFDFAYETNVYRIRRSKPKDKTTDLQFQILQADIHYQPGLGAVSLGGGAQKPADWKTLTEKSVRETEKAIQKTLRMDYDTFTNASFFLQGKADQFAQQQPADRKSILSRILGLDEWEIYRDRAIDERRNLEGELIGIDGRLREINAELDEGPVRRARLFELEEQLDRLVKARLAQVAGLESLRQRAALLTEQRRLVDTLANQLNKGMYGHDQLAGVLVERQVEQQDYARMLEGASKIAAAYQSWQAARGVLETWDKVAAQFRQYEKRRSAPLLEIETEKARLTQEAANLLRQQQGVNQALAETLLLETGRQAAQKALEAAAGQLERRGQLEQDRRDLQQRQAVARAENPRLRAEMDELRERIDRLSQAEGAVCPLCGQPLSPQDRMNLVESLNGQGKDMAERFHQNQALLKDFENQLNSLKKGIDDLTGLDNELRQQGRLVDQRGDRLSQIHQLASQWQELGEPRLQELEKQLREANFALNARQKLAEVDAELKVIGYDAAAHEAVRQAELNGRASETELRSLDKAQAALAPLEREISDMQVRLAAQKEDIARQKVVYDQSAASYAAAAAQMPDVDKAEQEMLVLQEQENRMRMEVGGARQKVDVLDQLHRRQKELNEARVGIAQRIARLKTLERAFGKDGVPALLIEQALPEIEDQANRILDGLSGGNMTVRFATQKEYKDRKRDDKKETLEIKISDGAGLRDYELYSGGEAFRVNFAIRLALSRVLAQRAGARLQTLVIDEGFGSQDAQGRQRLIEAINLVKADFSKILVITHLDELKDAFPNRIEVEKDEHGSQLRVI
ncbi:MAG TPA: SMC family ATPase [Anaerolineaceae bacterium]